MESQQIGLACNDEFIASIIVNSSENNEKLMSDDDFAQELQLQEVIMCSLMNIQSPKAKNNSEMGESSKTAVKAEEEGESSESLCEICAEKKDGDGNSVFAVRGCSHSFCKVCISRHITIKVKERATADALACPGGGCGGALDAAECRAVVPADVAAAWDEALCEAAIPAAERVYCPYKNCSALLVDDGGGLIREAECPFCWRLFCARCRVPWHAGLDCEGFAKLREDEREMEDLKVHQLAKDNKWKRCVNCHFFVERNQGCLHMTCRCGYQFCYACGKVWSSTHAGCQ